jgi:hypothetical protein
MGTLAEIEAAIPQLSLEELAELGKAVREARRGRDQNRAVSAIDLSPLHLGRVLRPLSPQDDLLGEMLDDLRI